MMRLGDDLTAWPLVITCDGVKCGACSTRIIPKRRGRPIATDVAVLLATIETHKPTCSAMKKDNACT